MAFDPHPHGDPPTNAIAMLAVKMRLSQSSRQDCRAAAREAARPAGPKPWEL